MENGRDTESDRFHLVTDKQQNNNMSINAMAARLERPERIKSPESSRTVARRASRKVFAGDPNERRKCPTIAEQLSNTRPRVAL